MQANVVPVRTEANESMPSIQMYSVRGVHVDTYGRRRSRIQVWVRKDTCRVIKQHHLFPGHAWPSKSLFFSYLLIWPRYQNLNHKIYHSINFTFRASCPYCLHTQDHASWGAVSWWENGASEQVFSLWSHWGGVPCLYGVGSITSSINTEKRENSQTCGKCLVCLSCLLDVFCSN